MKTIKKKILKIILINITLIFVFINNPILARYYEIIKNIKITSSIAEPIIVVEEKSPYTKLDFHKNIGEKEYEFCIKNFKNDKEVSEIDFNYFIEINNSNSDFPVNYKIYDLENSKELILNNDRSENLIIEKNKKTEKNYKLIVTWNKKENMSPSDEIIINIVAVQKT